MHVNRPENYTGPDTEPPKLDPNLLLQVCTGSNAEQEYDEVIRIGRKLLETYHEPEAEEAAATPSVVSTSDDRDDGDAAMMRSEDGLRAGQVRADPQHPQGTRRVGDREFLRAVRRSEDHLHAEGQGRQLLGRRRGGVGTLWCVHK